MVSSPEYGTILARDMGMSARDGVHLATDVWRPARDGEPLPGPFPAVMTRTPYDRTEPQFGPEAEFWTSRGFLFVVQDCRGRVRVGGGVRAVRERRTRRLRRRGVGRRAAVL